MGVAWGRRGEGGESGGEGSEAGASQLPVA